MRTTMLIRIVTVVSMLTVTSRGYAALINVPNLATVRVWESTGPFVAYDFAHNGTEMTTRLGVGTLGPAINDFSPLTVENYDVYYSDKHGNFDLQGDYVSVEAVFPVVTPQPGGGGLNLGAVDLLDSSGNSLGRADVLGSFLGRGTNYIAGSELLAVDADTPIPSTDTTMGNTFTTGAPVDHLRVTVAWSRYVVPEPTTMALALVGLCGIALGRTRRDRAANDEFAGVFAVGD